MSDVTRVHLRAAMVIASMMAIGACGGSGEADRNSGSAAVAEPTTESTGDPPENIGEVIVAGDYGECLVQAASTIDQADELQDLLAQDVNVSKAASPQLVDSLSSSMAECLGPQGVADTLVAEISLSSVRLTEETAVCLAGQIAGDETPLMRAYFGSVRQEQLSDELVTVAAGHFADCVPASPLVDLGQPVPLSLEEAQCVDEGFRSAPAFVAFFRSQVFGGSTMTEAELVDYAAPIYGCLDVPARVLAAVGGTAGLSEVALACTADVARSFGYYEGFLTEANAEAYESALLGCFSEADLAVLQARE